MMFTVSNLNDDLMSTRLYKRYWSEIMSFSLIDLYASKSERDLKRKSVVRTQCLRTQSRDMQNVPKVDPMDK